MRQPNLPQLLHQKYSPFRCYNKTASNRLKDHFEMIKDSIINVVLPLHHLQFPIRQNSCLIST